MRFQDSYSIVPVSVDVVAEFLASVRAMYARSLQIPGLLNIDYRACHEGFAALWDDQIVGIASIALKGIDHPTPGVFDTLFVLPAHRQMGLGSALSEAAIRRLLDLGRTPIYCHIVTDGGQEVIDHIDFRFRMHLKIRRSHSQFNDPIEVKL